jgi:hypothetical protein
MISRRTLLQTASAGFGYAAFAALANEAAARDLPAKGQLAPKSPHHPAKAKRVIFLCMDGGPSHVDTFDFKPKLQSDHGKPYSKGRLSGSKLYASPFEFSKHGQSGMAISELFPQLAKHADQLCLLNGMQTDLPNHPQAFLQMHCGIFQFPRPSMGAWTLYGLGTENSNLPGFVTVNPPAGNGGPANYGSSFLPAVYQGTKMGGGRAFSSDSQAVANIKNSAQSASAQRTQLDYMQKLNREKLAKDGENPGVEGLIESYELAFRMQSEFPQHADFSRESKETLESYGIGNGKPTDSFGRQCLLARKLSEAGVRFVELTLGGWDQHRNLKADLERNCTAIDRPIAALLGDLHKRGLLKETLVIWGGEFGRTPTAQLGDGRDHNAKGFSMWMAGGGVKAGFVHGKTDDYGFEAIEGKVHIHDWHATMLHLLGLNHEKLTYKYAGREMRLTDIKGQVVKEIIA